MRLVDVVLDHCELLDCPFAHIDESPHLGPGRSVQPFDCVLQLGLKLAVVGADEANDVDYLLKAGLHDIKLLATLVHKLKGEVLAEEGNEEESALVDAERTVPDEEVKELEDFRLNTLLLSLVLD